MKDIQSCDCCRYVFICFDFFGVFVWDNVDFQVGDVGSLSWFGVMFNYIMVDYEMISGIGIELLLVYFSFSKQEVIKVRVQK